MESSFCGCDQGALAGLHFDTEHLKDIGSGFCQALSMMKNGGDDWQKYVGIKSTYKVRFVRNKATRNSSPIKGVDWLAVDSEQSSM